MVKDLKTFEKVGRFPTLLAGSISFSILYNYLAHWVNMKQFWPKDFMENGKKF
jgi:hypothetical protein